MKYQASILALASLTQDVVAFPHMQRSARDTVIKPRQNSGSISGTDVPDPAQIAGIFDASTQYVSTTGDYVWVAPGPLDQRGPCPGLNAMANHGYIPHNGVATITVRTQAPVPR